MSDETQNPPVPQAAPDAPVVITLAPEWRLPGVPAELTLEEVLWQREHNIFWQDSLLTSEQLAAVAARALEIAVEEAASRTLATAAAPDSADGQGAESQESQESQADAGAESHVEVGVSDGLAEGVGVAAFLVAAATATGPEDTASEVETSAPAPRRSRR